MRQWRKGPTRREAGLLASVWERDVGQNPPPRQHRVDAGMGKRKNMGMKSVARRVRMRRMENRRMTIPRCTRHPIARRVTIVATQYINGEMPRPGLLYVVEIYGNIISVPACQATDN